MRFRLLKGDITTLEVDAIVNAANSRLLGGGGVDGAIHRAGGPDILRECMTIRERQGGCPVGQAVITGAGKLKAKYVIHAVGPIWHGGDSNEDQLLGAAYRNSLLLAATYHLHSIAFPNISTGIYGFPKQRAAGIAVDQARLFRESEHLIPDEIIFCCFDDENYALYQELLGED
jgi:O-acetyl-ADP-ribose deacetylase